MAVAAAPCEERDGHGRISGRPCRVARPACGPAVLCRCFLYYSRRPRSDLQTLPASFVKISLSRATIDRTGRPTDV